MNMKKRKMVFNWTLIESKWYYNEWNGGFFFIRNIYNINIIIIARSGIKAHSRQNGSQVEIENRVNECLEILFFVHSTKHVDSKIRNILYICTRNLIYCRVSIVPHAILTPQLCPQLSTTAYIDKQLVIISLV